MDGHRSKAPVIAIAAAVVALLTSIGAVVLLLTRGPDPVATPTASGSNAGRAGSAAAAGSAQAAPSGAIVETNISAAEVLKLKQRELIEDATDGVQVTDEALRTALKLQPDDIITAIGGRAVRRELEIYDAMMGLTMAETTTVYVDLLRDGKPVLARWKLDVSMRSAWRSSLGVGTYGSADPYSSSSMPRPTADPDPLIVTTIKKIDDTQVEAPRATVDTAFGFTVRGARMVPAIRNGAPDGLKLYAIRPGEMYAALGFENGDTIQAINGEQTPTFEKFTEVYAKQKTASKLTIDIVRRGKATQQTIIIK